MKRRKCIWFRFKNRKAELKQRAMLACFLMVLGQLPLRKTAKTLKITLTLTGGNFPWGQ